MSTVTVKFTANTTFQKVIDGPKIVIINPESGFSDMYIGGSAPGGTGNTFLLKPVAGENYLEIHLDGTEDLYVKSRRESSVVSFIIRDEPA